MVSPTAGLSRPTRVRLRTQSHVRFAAGSGFRGHGHRLRRGGRQGCGEFTAVCFGLRQLELRHAVAAAAFYRDHDRVLIRGLALIRIDHPDVKGISRADGTHTEGRLCRRKPELLNIEPTLACTWWKPTGCNIQSRVRGHLDHHLRIGWEVLHFCSETLGIPVLNLVAPQHLQRLVTGSGRGQRSWHLGTKLVLVVPELTQHDPFAITGGRPDFYFDIGADPGHVQAGVVEVDLDDLAGHDNLLLLGYPDGQILGIVQLTHVQLGLAAEQ